MAFPVVTLIINVVDKETMANLIPTFAYKVELTGFMPSVNEHAEVIRVMTEEKAKVIFTCRFINKYVREIHPELLNKNFRINMEVNSVT